MLWSKRIKMDSLSASSFKTFKGLNRIYFMLRPALKLFLITLSFIILAAIIIYSNPAKLLLIVSTSDLKMNFFALVLSSAAILIRCCKWAVLLPGAKFSDVVPVQLLGVTISNFSPGKAAEPAKAILLKMKTGISVSESLKSIIWERILDVLILLLLAFSALQILAVSGRFLVLSLLSIAIFLILVVVLFLILRRKYLASKILHFFRKVPFVDRIDDNFLENFYKQKIVNRKLLVSFLLTFAAWMLDGFVFYFAFRAVGITVDPLLFAGLIALATLVGIISFLPGGIGSMEISLLFILNSQGVTGPLAVSGVLLARLLSIWYVAFLGLLSFVYLGRRFDLKQIFK